MTRPARAEPAGVLPVNAGMTLYEDSGFTVRFADDRIIPHFRLEGVEARRRVEVFRIDLGTGEGLGLRRQQPCAKAAGWTSRSRSPSGPGMRSLRCWTRSERP